MSDLCEHTELPKDQCAHCRPKPAGGRRTPAQYRGTCTVCGGDITPGEFVSHTRGGWAHSRCTAVTSSGWVR